MIEHRIVQAIIIGALNSMHVIISEVTYLRTD